MSSIDDLFERLTKAAPEVQKIIDEHLDNFGERLPHLLMADVGRFVASHFTGHSTVPGKPPTKAELEGILRAIESSLAEGDEETENVIAVSFVEHLWLEPYYQELKDLLGPELRDEIERQLSWEAGLERPLGNAAA